MNKMNEVILGIDPSSIRCGWAILDGDILLSHGTICNDKVLYHERTAHIISVIESVVDQYDVTDFACERAFRNPHRNTAALQVVVQAIKSWTKLHKYPLGLYSPGQWKKTVVGSGKATKDEVQVAIGLYFPGMKGQEHEFDAAGTALHHQGMMRLEKMAK